MNLRAIIDVCKVRAGKCKGCIYDSSTCDHAKKILRVNKPMDYPLAYDKECEEYYGQGNDGESD